MTAIIGGHRRISLRAVAFVGVVFVVILIFASSSSRLHERLNTFRSNGYGGLSSGNHTSTSKGNDQPPHTPDYPQDAVERPSGNQTARDPCVDVALPNGGNSPKTVSGTRVLVTGGAGFIGSNLVDKLLELGYRVRVFDNLYTGFLRNIPLDDERVEFMFGDILDPEMMTKAVQDVEYVYHLAAMSKVVPSVKNPEMARFCVEANALGTWNVLNAVREKGKIKKVIYAASSTYYGNKPPPHQEDMAPDFLTPYAASKYEGELQMQMFDRLFQVPTISTRFFMVYGPRQPSTGAYAIVTGVFAKQAADGKQLTIEGDGSHYRDFIHVTDIVAGLILSQQSADLHGNVVNLGSGSAFSVQDVADLVSADQRHIDARKNDLEGTLADTCRMKKLLGYKTRADFKKEMSYMVKQTLEGNVFMQKWLTPTHALSAPHLLAPGTPVFRWPAKKTDLEALFLSLRHLNEVSDDHSSAQRTVTILPFTVGEADLSLMESLLLNTIHSLVRFGKITYYVVAAFDEKAFELCVALNAPCYDSRSTKAPELLSQVLSLGYEVHFAQVGHSYVAPVAAAFSKIRAEHSSAAILAAHPQGDVFIHNTDSSRTAASRWVDSSKSFSVEHVFQPDSWPETLTKHRATFSVQSLHNGFFTGSLDHASSNDFASAGDLSSVTSAPTASASTVAPPLSTPSGFAYERRDLSTSSPSPPQDLCHSNRFYVSVASTESSSLITSAAANATKNALDSAGLWHLTDCADKVHCDVQQTVPRRWVKTKPDLATHGGLC